MDADGGGLRRITNDEWSSAGPSWSPAGDELVFVYLTDDSSGLRIVNVTTGAVRALTPLKGLWRSPAWSLDGKHIVYRIHDFALDESHVEVMTVDGKESWAVTTGAARFNTSPAWTPAGDISFSLGDIDQSDIAVTGLRGGKVELLTDSAIRKDGLAWYSPRYFAVRALSILQPQVWGWLKEK
jgi:Tol biopolymer transport system component